MKRVLLALALAAPAAVFAEGAAHAALAGDAAAGASKAAVCAACHGVGGNGIINPEWPKLAGQHSAYIAGQLKAFKSNERKNPVMYGQAAALSDQDIADLGAYFAAQKPVPGVASKDAVKIAEKLYRAGDAARGLAACSACHGPTGAGNPAAQYPRIGGQSSAYTTIQLKAYKSGERAGGKHAPIMAAVAAKLTDEEIAALASYVNGLQ